VHYQGQRLSKKAPENLNLLKSLRSFKIPVPFSCGGEGICTTCRVLVLSGEVTKRTILETERANERGFKDNERLSCQCKALSKEIEVKIP